MYIHPDVFPPYISCIQRDTGCSVNDIYGPQQDDRSRGSQQSTTERQKRKTAPFERNNRLDTYTPYINGVFFVRDVQQWCYIEWCWLFVTWIRKYLSAIP